MNGLPRPADLDENGYPTREIGIPEVPEQKSGGVKLMQGSLCGECGKTR